MAVRAARPAEIGGDVESIQASDDVVDHLGWHRPRRQDDAGVGLGAGRTCDEEILRCEEGSVYKGPDPACKMEIRALPVRICAGVYEASRIPTATSLTHYGSAGSGLTLARRRQLE